MKSVINPSRRTWCHHSLSLLITTALAPCLQVHAAALTPTPPLILAKDAPPGMHPSGYLVSEKFDGVRAWWDGTTLRHRSGREVSAPAWFVAQLPKTALDGELWLGRGRFEALNSLTHQQNPPDEKWQHVRYMLFELPMAPGTFATRAAQIRQLVAAHSNSPLIAIEQSTLPSAAALQARLNEVVRQGGEGLMLHRADALYVSGRSDNLRKLKLAQDDEAVVIGHMPGSGRLQGLMGALHVRRPDGVQFLIGTGFTDAQRADPPPLGTVVTYTYRGTTVHGKPRFASFLRRRVTE